MLLALEMEEGARVKEGGQPPAAGKDKEADSPLGPPEAVQPCRQLDFSPARTISDV